MYHEFLDKEESNRLDYGCCCMVKLYCFRTLSRGVFAFGTLS